VYTGIVERENAVQGGKDTMPSLPVSASDEARRLRYAEVTERLRSLLEGETDWIAALATVASELHGSFEYFVWTGFYRAVGGNVLVIGPYQGGHGCLRIEYSRGVCGVAARTKKTQLVGDVRAFPGHIACSSETRSEIVVPVVAPESAGARLLGVLDVDSNHPNAFTAADAAALEAICASLGSRFATTDRL
jgi:L-methionine (R)-S-oxide reductase